MADDAIEAQRLEAQQALLRVAAGGIGHNKRVVRELKDKRTRTAKCFLLEDGRRQWIIHAKPIHEKVRGQWQDIDHSKPRAQADTYYGDAKDAHLYGVNMAYATARSTCYSCDATEHYLNIGQRELGAAYYVWRAALVFDTSAVHDEWYLTTNLYVCAEADHSTDADFDVNVVACTLTETICAVANREANYDAILAGSNLATLRDTSDGWVGDTYYNVAIDQSAINRTGTTYLGLISSEDQDNSAPGDETDEYVSIFSADYTGTDKDPYLSIVEGADTEISGECAEATAEALAPSVSTSSNVDVSGACAGATAEALAPAVQGFVADNPEVRPPAATATAEALAPTIASEENAVISAVCAEATAEALAPSVQTGATIAPPAAEATAEALAPSITSEVIYTLSHKVKINDVDRTDYIRTRSLRIVETLTNPVSTAEFEVIDGGALGLAAMQSVVISDAAETTRYFAGMIHEIRETESAGKLFYDVDCVDYAWDAEHPEELINTTYENQDDSAIIADAFGTALPDIDATADVATVYGSIPHLEFKHATPREILDKIANGAGARWYIDYGPGTASYKANLHYFDDAAGTASWGLSDSPTYSDSFAYWGLEETTPAPEANRVVVIYRGGTAVRTLGSEEDYGRWITTKLVDENIESAAQANEYGDNMLSQLAATKTYTLTTNKQGLRAGQQTSLVNSNRSINGNFVIQRVTTSFEGGGHALFEIEMGRFVPTLPDLVAASWRQEGAAGGGGGGGGGGGKTSQLWEEFDDHLHDILGSIGAGGLHDHIWGALNTLAKSHIHGISTTAESTSTGTAHCHTIGTTSATTGSSDGGPGHTHSYDKPASSTGNESSHTHMYDVAVSFTLPDASAHYHFVSSDDTDDEPAHQHESTLEIAKHDA